MDRRTFLKTGAGAAAGATIAAPHVARGAAPMTLRWAHFAPEDHPANTACKQFAKNVEARTNGAIRINIFPNNVLGGPPEQAQQIKLGTIDMGLPTQGQLDKYDTAFAAVLLPFIFDSPQQVYKVLDGPGMQWLAPRAEKQGFVLLHNWEYGFRNLSNSVRPINVPDDVKGLKIRTPPELQIQASMEALGASVVVADINAQDADGVARRIRDSGGAAGALAVDTRDTASVERMVDAVLREHGQLDFVLTTPAVNLRKRLADYSDDEFDRVIDLNLKGTFRVARACARPMVARKRGSIVLMSSMRAVNVEPGQSIYASTKAGIGQMTRGLAVELGPQGVRVNALAPGIVATPLTAPITGNPAWNDAYAQHTALGRWAEPEEMAGPIMFLASNASSYLTGTTIFADAGWTVMDGRFEPRLAT